MGWESVTSSHTQKAEVCLTEDDQAADRNYGLAVGHNTHTSS